MSSVASQVDRISKEIRQLEARKKRLWANILDSEVTSIMEDWEKSFHLAHEDGSLYDQTWFGARRFASDKHSRIVIVKERYQVITHLITLCFDTKLGKKVNLAAIEVAQKYSLAMGQHSRNRFSARRKRAPKYLKAIDCHWWH